MKAQTGLEVTLLSSSNSLSNVRPSDLESLIDEAIQT